MFQQIYSQHGFRGWFTGIFPRLIKVAPACAIMISSFEYGKIFFNRLANRELNYKVSDPEVATTPQKLSSEKSVTFKNSQVLKGTNENLL